MADQARLLDILARYLARAKQRFRTIVISGDMNAALEGLRKGYVGDFTTQDAQLQEFHDAQRFIKCSNWITHTWTPYNGRAQSAVLDYVWVWQAGGEGEFQAAVRQSPQERHDHRVVIAQMSNHLLPSLQDTTPPPPKRRLQMRKLAEYEDELHDHLRVFALQLNDEVDAVQQTEDTLAEATRWLDERIGTDKPLRRGEPQFQSAVLKKLNKQMKTMQRARLHVLQRIH